MLHSTSHILKSTFAKYPPSFTRLFKICRARFQEELVESGLSSHQDGLSSGVPAYWSNFSIDAGLAYVARHFSGSCLKFD